ncbi:hypothetical protein BH10ACT6_BH10ACT6_08510 [soil metagenome]
MRWRVIVLGASAVAAILAMLASRTQLRLRALAR